MPNDDSALFLLEEPASPRSYGYNLVACFDIVSSMQQGGGMVRVAPTRPTVSPYKPIVDPKETDIPRRYTYDKVQREQPATTDEQQIVEDELVNLPQDLLDEFEEAPEDMVDKRTFSPKPDHVKSNPNLYQHVPLSPNTPESPKHLTDTLTRFGLNNRRSPAHSRSQTPISRHLTIRVHLDCGFGNELYLRGDGLPGLSWEKGLLMTCVAPYLWEWTVDTADRDCEANVKVVMNDKWFQHGPNVKIKLEDTVKDLVPSF